MIPMKDLFIAITPAILFFIALFLDQYNYKLKFEKKLIKKKKKDIKLYKSNYPFCGGDDVKMEVELEAKKEK